MQIEKFQYYYDLSNLLKFENGALYLISRKKWCKKSHEDTIVSVGTYNYHISGKSMMIIELIYVDQTSYVREKIEVQNNVIDIIPFLKNNRIVFSKIKKKPYHSTIDENKFPLLVAPNGIFEMKYSWFDCKVIQVLAHYKPQSLFLDNQSVNYIHVNSPIFPYMQYDEGLMIEYFCKSIDNVYHLTTQDLIKIKNECIRKDPPDLAIGLTDKEIMI